MHPALQLLVANTLLSANSQHTPTNNYLDSHYFFHTASQFPANPERIRKRVEEGN